MNRLGMTLPERLGSIAWRYQMPLADWPAPPMPAWQLACEADEDGPIGDGPTARTERLARLEAVLFLAREPMATRKLAELGDLADGTEARTLVRKLNRLYDEEGCAFRAVEVAGGFQLVSRPQFASYLRRLHGPAVEVRLSAPAMETLSVVAYRQPVLRAAIESIRGVQCGELLRQLMERDLVRIAGRSEELGRPFLYGTTRRFLQVFGLRHLDELPPVETELLVDDVPDTPAGQPSIDGQLELATPSDESPLTEEESTVKIEIEGQEIPHPVEELSQILASEQVPQAEFEDDSSFDDEYEDEEDEDEDEEDEDDFEDSDEEYEEEDDDDGFEDSEWEEVEDDESDEDEEDWEEEEWDDDGEEDWEEEGQEEDEAWE